MTYWTPKEAAENLNVSIRHIRALIAEADTMPKQARWQFGRQLIDVTPKSSTRRMIRINPEKL